MLDSADGHLRTTVEYVSCPNPACKKIMLTVFHGAGRFQYIGDRKMWHGEGKMRRLRIRPATYARPLPDYIPKAIRDDYTEACAIVDLSPKSAAALARRALQEMIRDFHGITRATLFQELEALEKVVDPFTWQAIDAVRSIGNIGAHMEKDINIIIDVEPEEAIQLIRLIELLITEWYIHRHERQAALASIVALGESKKQAQKPALP